MRKNVKMNLSPCYERGTKKKNLNSRQNSHLWPPKHRAGALSTWVTESSWSARSGTRFTTQFDIDIADPCSIQETQKWVETCNSRSPLVNIYFNYRIWNPFSTKLLPRDHHAVVTRFLHFKVKTKSGKFTTQRVTKVWIVLCSDNFNKSRGR